MTGSPTPLLDPDGLERLRVAVQAHFTSDLVRHHLGLAGEAALGRGDVAGALRLVGGGTPTETLIRLFLLGDLVPAAQAATALAPLGIAGAAAAGLVRRTAEGVLAAMDLRPYSEEGGPDWWVVSDLGADVRRGRLDPEHVLGIGAAGLTLAQATIRHPVGRALDLGTGCGVQSLHLSRHAGSVTATDISDRALRIAATTAALNGMDWRLLKGSLLEPVRDEQFDLIVCNPPFVVGPAASGRAGGFTYRDSGLAGDSVCRRLVTELPDRLALGGTAQLLANWQITADEPWQDRLAGWLHGCDAWVWQREVAEPGEYIALWLRDAGLRRDDPAWRTAYEHWMSWFADAGVIAVGMGLVNLRRTDGGRPQVVLEDVPQAVEQPIGGEIAEWFGRIRRLAEAGESGLLAARLRACDDLVLDSRSLLGAPGWQVAYSQLRQSHGMRWEVETDPAVAGLVASCRGTVPVGALFEVLAASYQVPADQLASELLPVVSDLFRRGILLPVDDPDGRGVSQ